LAILILGLSLATALGPVVAWLDRWLSWTLSTVLVYVLLALLIIGLGWMTLPVLVNQAEQLIERAPALAERARRWLPASMGPLDGLTLENVFAQLTSIAAPLVTLPVQISTSLFDIFFVLALSLWAILAAPGFQKLLLSLVAQKRYERTNRVLAKLVTAAGGYFRGASLTGLVVGTATYFGLVLIGVSFPLVLALIAGVAEFIPMVGPFVSGALIVLVALLQSPTKALIALAFTVILQQIEGNFLVPNIMHPQTNMSPLAVVFALYAGASVAGILGALVSIPLTAAIWALTVEFLLPALRRQTGADVKGTEEA
jgi:predicted PurR-regulated permease PerM